MQDQPIGVEGFNIVSQQLEIETIQNIITRSDHFSGNEIDLQRQFANLHSLEGIYQENDKLVLNSRDDSIKFLHTTTISDADYEMSIKLDKTPGTEAGLVLYYREYAYIGISLEGNKVRGIGTHLKYAGPAMEATNIHHLKLRLKDYDLSLAYSEDGSQWTYYLNSFDVNAYQHNMLFNFSSLKTGSLLEGERQR